MNVRVRFAPSPTGYLHIGGARTALFNWLYARHTGGVFILRIEDTDTARNSQEAVHVILEGLQWLGLDWDEGPATPSAAGPSRGDRGPYFQSQRGDLYRRKVEQLLQSGHAYEKDGAVFFRMRREPVLIRDLIVGDVRRELTDREAVDPDFVILRSDGQPVFHFVNVVDDLEMGVTHVLRGEDHLSNTAKHLVLFEALGAAAPHYAHIPLILNGDGSKMSKRDHGASLATYVTEGFVPEAVVNYLCLLGWSPKNDREIMSLSEIVERFDLPQILRHNACFDWVKLQWMNGEYLRKVAFPEFQKGCLRAFEQAGLDLASFPAGYVEAALKTCVGKLKTYRDAVSYARFYFDSEVHFVEEAKARELTPANGSKLERLRSVFATLDPFDAAEAEKGMKALAAELGGKVGMLVHPMRVACTGAASGPSLYHLIEVLGRERVLHRLDRALALAANQ